MSDKICTKCKEVKALSDFCRDSSRKDGLHPWCKGCRSKQAHDYQVDNRDKRRKWSAKWRAENPERQRELNATSHARNRKKRNADSREYRKNNLEYMRELGKLWSKNNPDKWKVTKASRRAAKRRAIPDWSNDEFEDFAIREMYELSRIRKELTGIDWHVDHIVPLKSKKVCGLHCLANLQIITGSENMSKGNRVWPDMP